MKRLSRRAAFALSTLPLATPALAQTRLRWRMATSWPKNLPGPGVAARFLAERVAQLTDGRFEIQLFAAGEILPALQVLDGVGNGTVEMGHSAAFFWQGKNPAANFFTTLPFGPDPLEHQAWIERGGGQELWNALYEPFDVLPMLAGNTGPSMGGWFKRELEGPDAAKGLKIRVQGLGGEIWRRLGATPLALPPGDLLIALSSGAIDAVEFLGPVNDRPLGLFGPAPYYYAPGFNKPNGAAEAIVHRPAFERLPADFRAALTAAAAEAHARGLAEAHYENSAALEAMIRENGVQLRRFPAALLDRARREATGLIEEIGTKSALGGRILASLKAARERSATWRRVTLAGAIALQEAR